MPLYNPQETAAGAFKYQYVMTDIPPALTSALIANGKQAFAVTPAPLIPESTATIGGVAHIKAGGLFGSGLVALNQTISIQMQGIDVAAVTFTAAINLANQPWDIDIVATIFSNGTVEVRGEAVLGTASASSVVAIKNTAAYTMSIAGGVPVTVSNNYGTLAVGGSITLRQLIIQIS